MPYIKQSWRDLVDSRIDTLIEDLERFDSPDIDGVLNYTITKILLNAYKPVNYLSYERIIGLLTCIQLEMYRQRVAPYEDGKEYLHGGVY